VEQLRLFNYPEEQEQGFQLLPLGDYDKILISFSGGKDSLACTLLILEEAARKGIPLRKIELWHQEIDGDSIPFMDWPVTPNYVRAIGKALGLRVRFQWREGGFMREMLRENELSQGIKFEDINGEMIYLPTLRGKLNTRLRFPAKSPDLSRRWCSSYLKIDPFKRALNNSLEFLNARTLVITGERREESVNRAKYKEKELHSCNAGGKVNRTVHQWRPVIDWPEERVWEIIKSHHVQPHPGYMLGWNRLSCMACIFSTPDLWAMLKQIAPDRFYQLVEMEKRLEFTIDNQLTLEEMAAMGKSRIPEGSEKWINMALGTSFDEKDVFIKDWVMPAGAFHGAGGGPS
jgi:3'-phosphoadenosine 5'-phosphosulfate sulfotransferase (PAPS reductase)/FAD synthetase